MLSLNYYKVDTSGIKAVTNAVHIICCSPSLIGQLWADSLSDLLPLFISLHIPAIPTSSLCHRTFFLVGPLFSLARIGPFWE